MLTSVTSYWAAFTEWTPGGSKISLSQFQGTNPNEAGESPVTQDSITH